MVTDPIQLGKRQPKQRTLSQKWRAVSLNNKLIVVFSGITMLATVIYTTVAGWTLIEIHSGSADTHALAVAAKTQAEKMKSVSDAAEKIQTAAENMVTQDQRIADNAKNALDASNRQSKAALDASIAAARTDQRAWLGITEAGTPSKIAEGERFTFNIRLLNSGRTPALDVRQTGGWILLPASQSPNIEHEIEKRNPVNQGTIQPGGSRILGTTIDTSMTKQQADGIGNGSMTFYVFGKITYSDIFRVHHRTDFCIKLDAKDTGFGPCDSYNDEN